MDYLSAIKSFSAGDANGEQQLFALLRKDYYGLVAELPDQAQAEGLLRKAFAETTPNITSDSSAEAVKDTFRRSLEWSVLNVKNKEKKSDAGMNQAYQNQYGANASQAYGAQQYQGQAYQGYGQNMGGQAYQGYGQSMGATNMGTQTMGTQGYGQSMNNQMYQQSYNSQTTGNYTVSAPKKSVAPLVISIIAVVVIIGVIVGLVIMNRSSKSGGSNKTTVSGRTYEEMMDDYFEAYSNEDFQAMKDFYPEGVGEQVWDQSFTYLGYSGSDAFFAALEASYGKPFVITGKITNDEDYSASKAAYQVSFNLKYNVDYEFEDMRMLTVEETCSGSYNTYTFSEKIYIGKIDGEWYILGAPLY